MFCCKASRGTEAQVCDCKHDWLWVRSHSRKWIIYLKLYFHFLALVHGVEFRHSIRSAFRIRWKISICFSKVINWQSIDSLVLCWYLIALLIHRKKIHWGRRVVTQWSKVVAVIVTVVGSITTQGNELLLMIFFLSSLW